MHAPHRRYLLLVVAYVVVAGLVVTISAGFYGWVGLMLSVSGAVIGFALPALKLRDAISKLARDNYEREVGTRRVLAGIVALGLVLFPPFGIANSLVFNALFPDITATIVGSLGGAIFSAGSGALAARYFVSSRALKPTLAGSIWVRAE